MVLQLFLEPPASPCHPHSVQLPSTSVMQFITVYYCDSQLDCTVTGAFAYGRQRLHPAAGTQPPTSHRDDSSSDYSHRSVYTVTCERVHVCDVIASQKLNSASILWLLDDVFCCILSTCSVWAWQRIMVNCATSLIRSSSLTRQCWYMSEPLCNLSWRKGTYQWLTYSCINWDRSKYLKLIYFSFHDWKNTGGFWSLMHH